MSRFDTSIGEELYQVSLDGCQDDSTGSVDELGWFGLFKAENVILEEDSQGFVTTHLFDTVAERDDAWQTIEDDYDEYWSGDDS